MSGPTVADKETNGQTDGCKMCEYKGAIMITSNRVTPGTLLTSPFSYNHSLFRPQYIHTYLIGFGTWSSALSSPDVPG